MQTMEYDIVRHQLSGGSEESMGGGGPGECGQRK